MAGQRKNIELTAQQMADLIGATLVGDANQTVRGANVIERAAAHELAFIGSIANVSRICGH